MDLRLPVAAGRSVLTENVLHGFWDLNIWSSDSGTFGGTLGSVALLEEEYPRVGCDVSKPPSIPTWLPLIQAQGGRCEFWASSSRPSVHCLPPWHYDIMDPEVFLNGKPKQSLPFISYCGHSVLITPTEKLLIHRQTGSSEDRAWSTEPPLK